VAMFYNKDQEIKLIEKRKSIIKQFNGKYFICNKIRDATKGCRNKAQQSNPRK
jgi:hypothetical protein